MKKSTFCFWFEVGIWSERCIHRSNLVTNADFRLLPSLINRNVFGVLIGSVSFSCLSSTLPISSITVPCVHSSSKTSPASTHASVAVVERGTSHTHPWWTSGGVLANLIPKVNNFISVSSKFIFDSSGVQDCFPLSNEDTPFIVLFTSLLKLWAHTSPSSNRLVVVNENIPGKTSYNSLTYRCASCGVSLVFSILEYILLFSTPYR